MVAYQTRSIYTSETSQIYFKQVSKEQICNYLCIRKKTAIFQFYTCLQTSSSSRDKGVVTTSRGTTGDILSIFLVDLP